MPGEESRSYSKAMAKVLIIENDAAVARMLQDALQKKGHESHLTADGTEGLTLARTEEPQLIILCVELSRVSGYSICNKLKKDPDLGKIPLILTSSQATEETFEQHKKLKTRAEAYLKKPYAEGEIMGLVAQHLGEGGGGDVEVSLDDVSVEIDDDGDDLDVDLDAPAAPAPAPVKKPSAVARSPEVDAGATMVMSTAERQAMMRGAEPAAEPKPKPAAVPAATATSTGSVRAQGAAGAASSALTEENKQLRQKVQKLEQMIEQKEIEFNDRLLQESSRSREGVEIKKKLTALERDMAKFQQAEQKAKAEAAEAKQELERMRSEMKGAEGEKSQLSDKMGQLVDKVKQLAQERDGLRAELEQVQSEVAAAKEELENVTKMREKAKKAVDIAAQLIQETGLLQ